MVPDFDNKDLLLDTPEVHQLVATRGAEFIDVRYPADYLKGNLPNSHNITMRALSSMALKERIDGLEKVPYIGACYDKRSCFYSQLIGLRLERAGHEFLGRYSVPHEYYIPKGSERAHVSAWKDKQEQLTLASYVVTPLRSVLDFLVNLSGHYLLGLLGVVLLVRLILMPLALKAERDTRVQKSLKGRIDELRDELGDHPRAMSEATMALYKRFKIRPIINMLASVFQLGFMLLFYSAVSQSSLNWPHTFLWIEKASDKDPFYVLPILASLLFVGVLVAQSKPKTRLKKALFALGGVALFALLSQLGTAGSSKHGLIKDTGLVPLSQAHYLPESTGKKAARLGELIEAGFNVPDGFVFTSVITNRTRTSPGTALMDKREEKRLGAIWKNLKAKKVAVRSSGANEDGEENSFAGVYESILNVDREGLEAAVREVYASLCSERSNAYTRDAGNGQAVEADEGGVVVQKMIPAEFAGVMFTEHPGTTGAMMVELVSGLGEGELLESETGETMAPPVDMTPLLALGRELETLFGQPQDIEWAFAKGKFYLLQARDITRSIATGNSLKNLAEKERRKLLDAVLSEPKKGRRAKKSSADEPVFVQSELSELLPRPTPISADFMERLWASGGSTDLACGELGIPYNVNYRSAPYINTIFGWTYVNKKEESRRLGKGPGALASFKLARGAEDTEAQFRDEFLPTFQSEMIERNAIALERLNLEAATSMLDNWVTRFVEETYFEAERINISADFHMKTALDKLNGAKLEPALYLNDNEETVVSKAMALLSGDPVTTENIAEFLTVFGHRAPLDYELSLPRFNEDMNLVRQYIERSSGGHGQHATPTELPKQQVLAITIQRARTFDKKCNLEGRIFHLNLDEVISLAEEGQLEAMAKLAEQRFEAAQAWQSRQLPSTLSVSDLERLDMLTGLRPDAKSQVWFTS